MFKKVALLLLTVLFLAGCSMSPDKLNVDNVEISDRSVDAEVSDAVSLADMDLAIVPEEIYYILMEESLNQENRVLLRRYIKYDGFKNDISEQVINVPLPRSFQRIKDAKEFLSATAPEKLGLQPKTYLHESVRAHWEQEGYDYSIEAKNRITLEQLKRLGAVTRTSEFFAINTTPDDLVEKIAAVEEELLPKHPNLQSSREVDVLANSLVYRLNLSLYEKPLLERSAAIAEATIFLTYNVDELGHPLELTLKASFETKNRKINPLLTPVVNDMAVFAWTMRETLVENLKLYGVNENNPSMSFANTTLNFSGEEGGLLYTEHYFIK